MKNILKVAIPISLVAILTLILCSIFIKPKVFNFKTTSEYMYIQNNRKNIEEVTIRYEAQLGKSCYKIDTNKAYDILSNISIKKEGGWCSSPNIYLEFHFKNGRQEEIHFDCENLIYNGIGYKLKNEVSLVIKGEYMPDKITKGMIVVSKEDEIDCK